MSLCDGKGVSVFPRSLIKQFVDTYIKEHGESPKLLVVSKEDILDWTLSSFGGHPPEEVFGMKIMTATYLKPGEIDLAMGIK